MNTKNTFLPPSYEIPVKESGYMRLAQGENKFRIMTSPIMGSETWTEKDGEKKPVRCKMGVDVSKIDTGGVIKHFWSMVVWNYEANGGKGAAQILHITQSTIQNALRGYAYKEEWGNPKGTNGYDIVITRTGEGLDTNYQIIPLPHKKLPDGVEQFVKDLNINLEALFLGADPFASKEEKDFNKILDKQK